MHFSLCDMFSDLTQNSVEAGANLITVKLCILENKLSFELKDNGKGMSIKELEKAKDPFYTDGIKHPNRKVGLGIPFLIQTIQATEGKWNIDSTDGENSGTTISCSFNHNHIDSPPLGDLSGFFRQILSFNNNYEMIIKVSINDYKILKTNEKFELVRSELLEAMGLLDEGNFTDVQALGLLKQYIDGLLTEE